MATRELTPEQQQAMKTAAARARQQLASTKGRLTDQSTINQDDRTPQQKVEDRKTLETALALVRDQNMTLESVEATIMNIYGGKLNLSKPQVAVIAGYCHQNGLDPNPASGHLYVWYDYRKVKVGDKWETEKYLVMYIGYQAYVYKAHQQFDFQFMPTRAMTPDERDLHDLKPDDKGAVVSAMDFENAKKFAQCNMQPVALTACGIWRKEARYNKFKKKWGEDNTPNTWSAFQMAEKRGITKVLKLMGIKFNHELPDVDGLRYDPDTQTLYMPAPNAPDPDDDDVIDGTFTNGEPSEPDTNENKGETAPVVKRNGYDDNGKPIFEKVEEPPQQATIDDILDEMETEDGPDDTSNADELPPLSKVQVGQIRYELRKALDLKADDDITDHEAEICNTYEVLGGLEKVPSVYFKEIIKTVQGKKPKKPAAARPRQKDDRTIEPEEYDQLYEAVKLTVTSQDGFVERPDDELKADIERKIREWTGCNTLTVMTEKQWRRGMDTAKPKEKAKE